MKKLLLNNFFLRNVFAAMLLLIGFKSQGQVVIASDGFNNSSSLFTITGAGAYFTVNSVTGDRPASSPFASEGTHSYGISNGTATLTSTAINTSIYTGMSLSMRLASFSIGSTGNGADASDIVNVEVSPDGGATYYSTVRVLGPSAANAYWSYTTGTGNASTAYDGDTLPADFAPTSTGAQTTLGYSTVTVTGLPAVTNLRVRIILNNNVISERWVIDDFKVTGTLAAPTINGTIATNEYGTHTNGANQETNTITWYSSWSGTDLFFGIGNTNNNSTEAAVIYIDTNPIVPVNGGADANGTNVGNPYDRATYNPAFRADYVLYFKNGYYELRASNGTGGWNATPVTTGLTYAQSGIGAGQSQEISIPWSALGGFPASFNFSVSKVYDGGAANNGIYGQLPTDNPGGVQNQTAYTLFANRYYTVSSTTIGSATPPFSKISYCQPIGTTTNNFGTANFWDFTVNPGIGFQVARNNAAGDWNIANALVVGSGFLYFGSGGSGYGNTTVGSVNVVGGTLDMDQTNKPMTVNGNISIAASGTLKLSGTLGGDSSLLGNWNSAGTFTPNIRRVTFNGTTPQTMTGATIFDFVTLNNTTGLTLANDVTINSELALTNGRVTIGTNNLTLGATASIATPTATSYIVTNGTGTLIRNSVGNTATLFPIGLNTTNFTPITVTNTAGTSNLAINVKSNPFTQVPFDATKVVNLEWGINSSAATTAVVAPIWVATNQAGSFTNTGAGEIGNYVPSAYTIYPVTLSTTTTSASGVSLSSGNNKIVVGNTAAIFAAPPTITSFAASGCVGTQVVVTGTNLSGVTALTVGGTSATRSANTATSITFTVPTTASGVIAITAATGSVTSATNFTINPLPTTTWGAAALAVCQNTNTQNTTLSYSATTNAPTAYSISWNATPANTFAAITNQTFAGTASGGTITIVVPASTAAGTYTGTISVQNANGCVSTGTQTFTVTAGTVPIATATNNGPYCEGETIQLTSGTIGNAGYLWSGPNGFSGTNNVVTYTQDFDTLPTTLNGWTDNISLPGWYINGTNFLGSDDGGSNTGGMRNYGLLGNTNRTFGSLNSATSAGSGQNPTGLRYGVKIINTTGQAVTNVIISYKAMQFKNQTATLR